VTEVSRGARRAIIALLALVLIVGAGNLWASYSEVHNSEAAQRSEQAAQERQGVLAEQKPCQTLGSLAAETPPPGNPRTNPSRGYLQGLHTRLAELGTDLGGGRPR
jgi:hypothetical protein